MDQRGTITSGRIIVGPQGEVGEEFTIRAVNCHEELLAACRALLAVIDRHIGGGAPVGFWKGDYDRCNQARVAIAKAEGAPHDAT